MYLVATLISCFIILYIFGVQVQCPLEVVNLRPSRDVAVLDFSYKFGIDMVLLISGDCATDN